MGKGVHLVSSQSQKTKIQKIMILTFLGFFVPTAFCLLAARFSFLVLSTHRMDHAEVVRQTTARIAPIGDVKFHEEKVVPQKDKGAG